MEYTDKLEENLIELQNQLIWHTYKVGRYNIFYVYEPKKRMIMSLQFKDRVAQHAIYTQLNPYFEKQFIFDSYACRVGKGTHRAVNRLHNWMKQTDRKPQKWYYLKLDISKYFYRVDHEILMDILKRKIADKELLDLLSIIINCEDTHFGLPLGADVGNVAYDELLGEVGLPIGNLTSQMFANLYLNELDQFCKHKLKLKYYIRYMDDIIIMHHDKKFLERVKQEIAAFLEDNLRLQLNNKTCIRPTSMGVEFVGFRIWSTHIKLRKKTAKKMKRRLKYLFGAYAAGEIDRETLERSIASYNGIMQHFNSNGLRQSLNELYIKENQKAKAKEG
jgi:retron-type reverse transcriptase